MGKFADTFLGQPTPGGSAGGSPNTTQQTNVVGNSFAKQFNVSPELWRQEPVQTMPVQTVEPIQEKKQNFIQKGLQKAGNVIKNIFNPKAIEPTMYFDESPFINPQDVKQKNILQLLLEPTPEKYRKQSILRSLNPIANLKDSIAITQELLSKPEYYNLTGDLADIQEGKFIDTKIKEAQDFLSDPEAYVNLFGNPKYPVYGVHLAEALARIQKPYVDSLNANPAWQGLNIGLSNTLLGSSEEVKKSLDQQLVKPVDGFGKTLYKVNEITGSIIPWVLGMNSLKATKLAKLAFPIVSATLGQTSVNANLEQRLKKLPVDVVAGWLYSIVPISKMSWTRQGMIDLARGTTAFASIGGISGFINSLTLGMSKEEALENAKNIATTMALFHVAGQITNYFLTPQQAMGNKTYSPQEIRDMVDSSKYKNTPIAKDLMKISLEAEQYGKNVTFDYGAKGSSPLVKIGNKIFGKEILEKIGVEYKSIGQFKYTLVDAPQPSMLPGQAVPETGITTTGTPTPQTPTPVAPVVPVQQPPKAPITKTPDVIKEPKVEYKSVEDLLDDGVKNIKTTPELDKIVKETRLPDVVEQYDDIYKNVIDKLPEPEFGKIRVFSSNGSLTQDKINVGDFSDVDYLTDSLEGHFQYRYSPDEGIVVADVDPDKIAIMEGGRGDFGYYRVVKKLTPEDIVYSKAVNTGIESQEIKKDSTEGIVEPPKKAVSQQKQGYSTDLVSEAKKYKSAEEFVSSMFGKNFDNNKYLNFLDDYKKTTGRDIGFADSLNMTKQEWRENVLKPAITDIWNKANNKSKKSISSKKTKVDPKQTKTAQKTTKVVSKTTDSTVESNEQAIRDTYKKNEEKVYDALSQVFAEMEIAEAGQRLFIEQPDSSDPKIIGISSTFPKWIPEELRSRELFDKVLSGIVDIDGLKYPGGNRTAQRALYDAILDEVDRRSGVDTSKYRGAIIDLYEKPSTKQTIKAKKPVSKRIEGGEKPKQVSKEKPQEKPQEKQVTKSTIKTTAKDEFKVGDVLDPQGNSNMVGKVTIREISGNTLKFTDSEGTEFAGMQRSVVRDLIKGGEWKRSSSNKTFLTGKEAEEHIKRVVERTKTKYVGGVRQPKPSFKSILDQRSPYELGYKPSGEVGKYVEEQIKKHPEKIIHKTSATKADYRGNHEAPTAEGSAPLYDVAGIYTENQIYPEDIYGANAVQYYGHFGDPAMDAKAIAIIKAYKGHPDKPITVYRAVPKNVSSTLNVGDWVTTVREYAKEHGESALDGDYKIVSKTVQARDLFTDGNSIFEFGYDPQPFVNLRDRPFDMLLERQKEGLKQAYAKEAVGSGSSEELGYNPKNIKEPNAPETKKELDKIIKRSDIAKELSEKFNVPIRTGKFRRSALGIYKMRPEVVRLKGGGKSGGLPTVFHEVGHHLDKHFNMSDDINIKERKDLMTEYGFSYEGKPKLQKQEAFAEFIRYRTTGQNEKIARFAPEFSKTFEKRMDDLPEIKEALDKARDDWRRWNEQPAVAKVLSQISIGKQPGKTLPERLNSSLHELYTSALDDIHPLSEFSKIAKKKLGAVPAEQDPYILARTLRGWSGKADLFLNKGTFGKTYWKVEDGKTKMVFTGKPYSEIMRPIDKAGMMDEFRVYIVSERAIELAERGIVSGVSKRDAQEAIADLESKYPEIDFKKISEERRKYKDSLLNYAKDSGLVGDDGLKMIKELNKYHVPFYRVMEETISGYMGGRKLGGNISSPIKKIRGSERDIIDPLESDVKDTYAILNASERNNIGIAMANLASKDPELGRLFEKVDAPMSATKVQDEEIKAGIIKKIGIPLEFLDPNIQIMLDDLISDVGLTVFRPIQDRGSNMLNVNRGDKKEVYQVEQDLFRAIQGLNVEDVGLAMRILATPAKLLRAGATLSPDFSVRNPIRDQFSAMIYSNYGFRPGIDMLRGMFELFGKGDAYNLWKASGGESSTLVSIDRDFLQKSFQDILKSNGAKALDYIKNPIELLRVISEIGEQSTRLGEMKRALEKQATPLEGAYSSREVTLDFAKIGAKTKALNLISAFWNANVQGTDKMVRSFKTHPFRTLLKTLLGITLPSILLYFANRDDERWDEIPAWQKNLFWIVMTPEHIYRIPKPFELGIIFGSIPERVLEYIDEQDKTLFDDLLKSIADGASPGFIPTALIPIIENITNYSFFRERPIVSQGQEDFPPEAQYGTYTSELSKIIGEALNYSPSKVDNLIQGYTGGLGKYATSAIDSVLKGTGIVTPPASPAKTMEDLPVIRAFMIRKPTGSSSESVNKVYNMYSESTGQHKYVKKMIESGKIDEAKEYIKNNPSVANSGVLTVAINTFSQINKARDAVRNSRDLSPEEKRIKIAELDELMLSVAQQVLKGIENEQN